MFRRLVIFLSLGCFAVQPAWAQSKALLVLRFNQPKVYYEQPLYDAVAKAVSLKPTVAFDVVSYAPSTGNPALDGAWQQTASHNTQAVVASMQRMGIPMARIRVSGQHMAGIQYDEVHIFVR